MLKYLYNLIKTKMKIKQNENLFSQGKDLIRTAVILFAIIACKSNLDVVVHLIPIIEILINNFIKRKRIKIVGKKSNQ